MDDPRTPEEHRRWWEERAPVPYGLCWCGCGEKTGPAHRNHARVGYVKGEPARYLPGHQGRNDGRIRAVRAMHEAKMSKKAIARELGITPHAVRRALGEVR